MFFYPFLHKIIIKRVKPRILFYDRENVEKLTKRKRSKYKLAINRLKDIQIYPFYILNSELTCKKYFAFKIDQDDWENVKQGYLKKDCSYIDIRNLEIMKQGELSGKIKRYWNFFRVAKLEDSKFIELCSFSEKICQTSEVEDVKKGLILQELTGDDKGYNIDGILNKYKI